MHKVPHKKEALEAFYKRVKSNGEKIVYKEFATAIFEAKKGAQGAPGKKMTRQSSSVNQASKKMTRQSSSVNQASKKMTRQSSSVNQASKKMNRQSSSVNKSGAAEAKKESKD